MHKKPLLSFFGIAFALMIVSCERLDEPDPWAGEPMNLNSFLAEDIPLAHGRFVSVTTTQNPFVVTLWFERPDQTVIAVRVNTSRGTIGESVISIPRR